MISYHCLTVMIPCADNLRIVSLVYPEVYYNPFFVLLRTIYLCRPKPIIYARFQSSRCCCAGTLPLSRPYDLVGFARLGLGPG